MLLKKISIYSCTKKLFQKTVDNVKSFLSSGYQRLPESPPRNSAPLNRNGVDINPEKSKCRSETKTIKTKRNDAKTSTPGPRRDDHMAKFPKVGHSKGEEINGTNGVRNEKKIVHRRKRRHDHSNPEMVKGQASNNYQVVARKLKELKMMDKSNVEHVLDIEEVLHHYSHLTCPAYRDIVDNFFMDMYSELSLTQASSHDFMPRLRKSK